MPSPFNNDSEQPVVNATGARVEEEEVHGEMYCEMCFKCTGDGLYARSAKRLRWTCSHCEHENVVRNIEL